MKPNTKDWGVVDFDVTTDQTHNIEHICAIALSGHRAVSHYQVVIQEDESNVLYLFWTKSDKNTELPFPLDTPLAMAQFISTWLEKRAIYPDNCYSGGDGDSNKGVHITNKFECHSDIYQFYVVACVEPDWVYYSK